MKKLTLTALALLAAFSSSAQAEEELRFGVDPTFAPFETKAPDGSLQGFDIDLGNAICQQLQVKCTWVQSSFDGLIPALQARKFDAILSGMSMTDKRREQVMFSDMIYNLPSALLTPKGSTLLPNVESLKGKRVAVSQGSTQENFVKEQWAPKGVDMVSYQNESEIYPDLIAGRLDAVFINAVAAESGFLNTPAGADYKIAGEPMYDKHYFGNGTGIALRKDDNKHAEQINQALAELHKNGTYNKMMKQYFSFDIYKQPE